MKYKKSVTCTVLCMLLMCSLSIQGFAMDIFIKKPDKSTITLEVENGDTVGSIKEKIYGKTAIPCSQQQLLFAGISLKDEYTLQYYNIQREATLHLIVVPAISFKNDSIRTIGVKQACVLILTSYNGNRLVDAKMIDIDNDVVQDISEAGLITEGTTRITAMLWDDFESIRPLCKGVNR